MKALPGKLALEIFIFTGSLLSGLILIGVCSSFSFMLAEGGVNVATITNILLATIPYSWKFAISPFITNLITRFDNSRFNIIKIISYIALSVMFVGFSSLGLYSNKNSMIAPSITIFVIVIAISIHDIVRSYIKLAMFEKKEFGIISAVENVGFRIGMFIAGACIIYVANIKGWPYAFMLIGSGTSAVVAISTLLIGRVSSIDSSEVMNVADIKKYVTSSFKFFKKYRLWALLLVLLSFKFSDSSINVLKPSFLHHLGVSRVAFANISHLFGMFSTVVGGIIAGVATYKLGTDKCVRLTLFGQMAASCTFIYIAVYGAELVTMAILINLSTFVFGFSGVIFRTFASEESCRDVNVYTILLSIGSLIRILSYSFSGIIAGSYAWWIIYLICLISSIPGLVIYYRIPFRFRQDHKRF